MARKGNQTPTKKVYLEGKRSLYREAIDFYKRTSRKIQPWQRDLLHKIMLQDKQKLWTHTKFGYSIPRRNGKNEVVAVREMWGILNGEKILHTAHRTSASGMAWERLMLLLDLGGFEYKALRGNGKESIEVEAVGGKIEFRTRTSKGGLGEGFDLLIIDEAQEYTQEQESALKYTVTDSRNPQIIFCGTPPTPNTIGTVFVDYRELVLYGQIERAGWAEWGVEEQTDIRDREAWYLTNPSLGTVITERAIADEVGSDELDFNIQRLGWWASYNQKSVISKQEWETLRAEHIPTLVGHMFVGVKYSYKGNVALSIAIRTKDNNIFVEVVDCRPIREGNLWIIDFIKKAKPKLVVIDGSGLQTALAHEMKLSKLPEPVLPRVSDVITANAIFEQKLLEESIIHMGQPSLEQVVTNTSKRPIGQSGFGYKSQIDEFDIALLDSVLLATWANITHIDLGRQRVSY